jgi:hypothetical protein
VARIVGQTFTRKGNFKGADLMGTLSEAGGVSHLSQVCTILDPSAIFIDKPPALERTLC